MATSTNGQSAQSSNGTVNNPVAQIAQMYNFLEAHLRKGPIGMSDLLAKDDIRKHAKNAFQVRDLIKTLIKRGHVIKTGSSTDARYVWDPKSPPFVLPTRQMKQKHTAPSEPQVTSFTDRRATTKVATATKEVELVLPSTKPGEQATSVIIGRNPATGRIRITIEEI